MTSRAEPSLWHYFGFFLFSLVFVVVSDLSKTWIALLTIGLSFAAIAFWFKNLKLVLFFGYVFSCTIHLTKALIVEGGIYTPGLSLTVSDLFLIPLLSIWFLEKKIFLKQKIYWSKLHVIPLLFLLWLWFSVSYSGDRFAGFLMCLNYTKYFFVFVFLSDFISNVKYLKLALLAFAMGLCVHFSLAFVEISAGKIINIQGTKTTPTGTQLVFEQAGGVHAFRPSGFAGHPNSLANILVFTLPTFLILILLGKKMVGPVERLVISSIFFVGLAVLVLTLSRAGWISFTLACIYLLYFGYKRGVVPKTYVQGLLVYAMLGGIATVLIFPTALLRITESDQRSGESRIAMLHQAALIIQRNPILGVGLAGYNRAAQSNIPEYYSHLSPWFQGELLKGVVHNKYLLVMGETGTIGVTLFVLMLYQFVKVVPRGDFWTNPVYFSLALGIAAGIFGECAFYMFDHFYSDPRIAQLFIFFGLITSVVKLQKLENASLSGASPA